MNACTAIDFHVSMCMNMHKKTCNITQCGHIIKVLCLIFLYKILRLASMARNTNSPVFLIALCDFKNIIFVLRSSVSKSGTCRKQLYNEDNKKISQITREKEVVFIIDDHRKINRGEIPEVWH